MLQKQSASAHKITRAMVTGIVTITGTNVDISLGKTRRNPSLQWDNSRNEKKKLKRSLSELATK
jgi:hypothetical protein